MARVTGVVCINKDSHRQKIDVMVWTKVGGEREVYAKNCQQHQADTVSQFGILRDGKGIAKKAPQKFPFLFYLTFLLLSLSARTEQNLVGLQQAHPPLPQYCQNSGLSPSIHTQRGMIGSSSCLLVSCPCQSCCPPLEFFACPVPWPTQIQ